MLSTQRAPRSRHGGVANDTRQPRCTALTRRYEPCHPQALPKRCHARGLLSGHTTVPRVPVGRTKCTVKSSVMAPSFERGGACTWPGPPAAVGQLLGRLDSTRPRQHRWNLAPGVPVHAPAGAPALLVTVRKHGASVVALRVQQCAGRGTKPNKKTWQLRFGRRHCGSTVAPPRHNHDRHACVVGRRGTRASASSTWPFRELE